MLLMGNLGPTHTMKSLLSLNSLRLLGARPRKETEIEGPGKAGRHPVGFSRTWESEERGKSGADPQLHQHPTNTGLAHP